MQNQPAGGIIREPILESDREYWDRKGIHPFWDDKAGNYVIDWKIRDCYTAGDPEKYTLVDAD
jgi:hypothetical protein